MSSHLSGTSASQGIAQGPAFVVKNDGLAQLPMTKFVSEAHEKSQLQLAVGKTKENLEALQKKVSEESGPEEAAIFEAHALILEDPEILEQTEDLIIKKKSASQAYLAITDEFIKTMSDLDDDYLRGRAIDLKDVRDQVLGYLLDRPADDLQRLKEPSVIVARDLTPSQFASMNKSLVLALVTEIGGKNSHTAIMARVHDIPTVVGVSGASGAIATDQWVIVDAASGKLYLQPDAQEVESTKKQIQKIQETKKTLMLLKNQPSLTKDSHKVKIEANIGHPEDVALIEKYGCEGVGLFRTEFLFLGRNSAPQEEAQYQIYRKVVEACGDHGAVIRTLDVGGDKQISYLNIPKEENPFLGLRAVRYCLKNPDFFKIQLRALLRASAHGKLSVMFPMVNRVEEVLECKALIAECQKELKEKNQKFDLKMQVGIMIEIPSAALICDQLAAHVDFVSIGTNDLIQYMCAVDRMNEQVSDLYESFHPAVLRLVASVIETAKAHGIEAAVCGEMAGDPLAIPLLLGMGLEQFSQNPSSVLKTRALLQKISFADAKDLWKRVSLLTQISDIRKLVTEFSV